MIMSWPNWSIRPVDGSLPKATWRGERGSQLMAARYEHRYPVKGCQGEPLPERKPCKASNARSLSLRDMGFELGACACEETP